MALEVIAGLFIIPDGFFFVNRETEGISFNVDKIFLGNW